MTTSFDPLATSNLIVEGYRRYLRSLLPVRDPGIAAALDHEISRSRLTKGPLLEAAPPYEHGVTLADLVAEGVLNPSFPGLASRAVPLDRPLYRHQEQAIRKITAGRNVIVATGTGSGKTESFLLPILDALSAEHAAGTLGPGVRALLLYPMNALANDQIKRLREALRRCPAHHLRPVRGRHAAHRPGGGGKVCRAEPGPAEPAQRAAEPGGDARGHRRTSCSPTTPCWSTCCCARPTSTCSKARTAGTGASSPWTRRTSTTGRRPPSWPCCSAASATGSLAGGRCGASPPAPRWATIPLR